MKLTKENIKKLLEAQIEDKLIDNLTGYYFKGEFVPTLVTEEEIVFYATGTNKFYHTPYEWGDDGLTLEGLKKVSIDVDAEDSMDKKFEEVAKGIFEIDEGKEIFRKSLKSLKGLIKENEVVINEDVFLSRMKEQGLSKSKFWLSKSGKGYDNWDGVINKFSETMQGVNPTVLDILHKKSKNNFSGSDVDKFYDYLDISKIKFSHQDGKGLYKALKINFPKSKIWISENKELLISKKLNYNTELAPYSSAVDDVAKMLRGKKYVDDVEFNPAEEKTSELLGVMKRAKEKAAKGFWKWDNFKNMVKEMKNEEIEVEDFINKFDILNAFSKKDLTKLMEKTLINIYDDVSIIGEAKKIAEILDFVMESEGYRDEYFSEITGTEFYNSSKFVNEETNDIGAMIKAYRDVDDIGIIYVKNLATTIEEQIAKYREDDMSVDDMRILESALFKLNDIWARQRITDKDKKFIKAIEESFMSINDNDKRMADSITAEKDRVKSGIDSFESEILKRNANKKVDSE